jgi:hypothetical protein
MDSLPKGIAWIEDQILAMVCSSDTFLVQNALEQHSGI